jgi:hypothetical protein
VQLITLSRRVVPRRCLTLTAVAAAGVGSFVSGIGTASAATSSCSATELCTVTFAPTGAVETWTVPAGIETITIVVAGASGGDAGSEQGGVGGEVTAEVPVTPGETLDVVVGRTGADGAANSTAAAAGGFGGGGAGGTMQVAATLTGGGGGGGSFVFVHGTSSSELLVAAGGGGGAVSAFEEGDGSSRAGGTGGAGGDAVASTNTEGLAGGPATLTAAGAAGAAGGQSTPGTQGSPGAAAAATSATSLGLGGAGAVNTVGQSLYFTAGGGGGGYRGGGGGGTDAYGGFVGPGGGGAGFLSADARSVETDTNDGAGLVTVSYQQVAAQPRVDTPSTNSAPVADESARANVGDNKIVPGAKQTITGTGFTPGETVHGVLHSRIIDLGTAVADSNGVVVFTVTLPDSFELGSHSAVLTGATSGRVATVHFVVTASVSSSQLAYTGASLTPPLLGGLAAVAAGAALIVVARRRRTQV